MIHIAVTSLWKVSNNLKQTIEYTEDKNKTKYFKDLDSTIKYAMNEDKTEESFFISGINCNVESALEEMIDVKKTFNKEKGILAFHGYQSFKEDEVSPELAHKIGIELANEMWGDKYQVIVTTHLNTNHIHNHFVVNSVSFIDGKKYSYTNKEIASLRNTNDSICEKYNLSHLEEKATKSGTDYRYYLGKNNYSKSAKRDIDIAINSSYSYKEFESTLESMGYKVSYRYEHLTIKHKNYKRNIRVDREFGEEYTIDSIKRRIKLPKKLLDENYYINYYHIKKKEKKKYHGLIGLYRYYCFLLKIYPSYPKKYKITYQMRQDLNKLDELNKQTVFLAKYNLDTEEKFNNYYDELSQKIKSSNDKEQINLIREDLKLMNQISERIKKINENLEEYEKDKKELIRDEWRSSRTSS